MISSFWYVCLTKGAGVWITLLVGLESGQGQLGFSRGASGYGHFQQQQAAQARPGPHLVSRLFWTAALNYCFEPLLGTAA